MNISIQKIVFLIYYLTIIFLSINNFNIQELQSLYEFFDDKDKFMHFIQYFILIVLALATFKVVINFKSFMLFLLFIIISSGTAEFIQLYLSSRDSSYIDSFYDILGGVCGFLVFSGVNRLCCKN